MSEPMSVGDCVGVQPTVTWNGKAYTLSRPTPKVLAAIEVAIASDVLAEAREMESIDSGSVPEARKNLASRWHRVGGPYWDAAFKTSQSQFLQLWAMVQANHPEFTREQAAEMYRDSTDEVELALILSAPDFFEQVAARLNMGRQRADERLKVQRENQERALKERQPK